MRSRRRAIGEVVSSLTMLMITLSILGGLSLVSLQSIRNSSNILAQGSQSQTREAGQLFTLVAVQSNTSGSYVWLFNYGWTSGRITGVYLDGGLVSGWRSSCPTINPGTLCVVRVPRTAAGNLSISFGSKIIAIPT